jgi:membrane protease YdiL (CAAX protease family)
LERGNLTDIGLGWTSGSAINLGIGLLGGAGAAILVTGLPLAGGQARFVLEPGSAAGWPSILFVSVVLLFGAVGEEMLFHGYGFQAPMPVLGAYATILPFAALFGISHFNNPHATLLGAVNTVGWGILFGYAFLRSGDLWLPIGLHFGWNVVLPLFGAPLSGFKIIVTGYSLKWSSPELWSGGAYGPEASLLTTGVLVLLFWYLGKAPVDHHRAFLLREMEED